MPGGVGDGMVMPIGVGRRSRWKSWFGHRSSSSPSLSLSSVTTTSNSSSSSGDNGVGGVGGIIAPPASFICPISSSLMYDPVIVVSTGLTFERACIQQAASFCCAAQQQPHSHSECEEEEDIVGGFSPAAPNPNSSSSSSSHFFFIPNSALRAAIIDWCDRLGVPHPSPIPLQSARLLAHNFISTNPPYSLSSTVSIPQSPPPQEELQGKQTEEQQGGKDHLNKTLTTITTEKQSNSSSTFSSSSSSSSSSSEIAANFLTVSSSSSSSSSDDAKIVPTAEPTTASTTTTTTSSMMMMTRMDPLEEEILVKLKSPQISLRESGVIALRRSTRDSPDCRASLCTPRILAALLPMIPPSGRTSPPLRINATAALVNLSIDPPANKVRIVRSGAVPPLVEALRSTRSTTEEEEEEEEARYNAAGALFSLSLEDGNKLAIGVLGAIPPLVHLFSQPSARQAARLEAGMAVYHLSLAPNNLSKIAKAPGAVKAILNIAQGKGNSNDQEGHHRDDEEDEKISILLRLQRVAMMVLASLARRNEGRVALMDAGAVNAMVRMMEDERERLSTGGSSSTSNTASSGKEEEYCLGVLYEMSRASLRFRALARAAGAERVLISVVTASQQEASRSGEVAKEMARRILKVIRGDQEERRMSAAMMLLRNKTQTEEDDDEGEIGSVVSDGLVSFRRRYNDDFGGGSASNSANF